MRLAGLGAATRSLVVAVLALMLGSPAWADRLEVPDDFATIQEAVDAAAAGDTVRVKGGGGSGPSGAYEENVVIDQVSIILECRKATIDVSKTQTTRNGVDYSAGITVVVDAVMVQGCTVKFARNCSAPECPNNSDQGDGIDVQANDFTAEDNKLIGCANHGLSLVGDNYQLSGNDSIHNGCNGFQLGNTAAADCDDDSQSNMGVAEGNFAMGNEDNGFEICGDNGWFVENRALQNDNEGFRVGGDGNHFDSNSAYVNGTAGFDFLHAQETTVEDNEAKRNDNFGFRLRQGDGNVFVGNEATFNNVGGFGVGNATGPAVLNLSMEDNESESNQGDGFCLSNVQGSQVTENKSEKNAKHGFICDGCDTVTFRENASESNGENGFEDRSGNANVYTHNESEENSDGFHFSGAPCNDMTLELNKAADNYADGVDIDCTTATGIVINENEVGDNQGTGIENDAQGTDITANEVEDNRTDIAGAGDEGTTTGTLGEFVLNEFLTGGETVATPGTGPDE